MDIIERKIDLCDVDNFLVVCHSYSSALFTNPEYDIHHIFIPKENDILWYLSKPEDIYTIDFVSKSELDVKTRKLTPFV